MFDLGKTTLTLAALAVTLTSAAAAQIGEPAPRPDAPASPRAVTPDDYGQFESLGFGQLSPKGDWLAVGIGRVNDEDELRIRRVGADSLISVPYGTGATFSDDGRWLAFAVGMSEDERKKLEKQKKRPENGLGLLDLAEGDTALIPGVQSFAFSADGRYLAMRRYPAGQASGDDAHGADLVIRDLTGGPDVNFGNVGEFDWQDDGVLLAMTVDAADNAGNGVRLWDPTDGRIRTLDARTADYKRLAWREDADDLVVLRVVEDDDYDDPTHVVMAWTDVTGRTRAHSFDPREHGGFPADTRVVDYSGADWSDDGRALFFGIKEWTLSDDGKKARQAAADSADEDPGARSPAGDEVDSAGVEVWHSRDVDILPRQKITASADRRDNHLSVWHLDEDRFVQLENELTESVRRVEGDRIVIGTDGTPYDTERMFGPEFEDVYVIDTRTGERRRIVEKVQYGFGPSTAGKYYLYLRDDDYHVYDLGRDRHVNITGGIDAVFVDLEDDHTVQQKPPFRYAGWTENDDALIVYDKYDIWEVKPDGSGGRRLTNGRDDQVVHRYSFVSRGEDEDFINTRRPMYVSLTGEWTKWNGYGVMRRWGRDIERTLWQNAAVGRLVKADDADVFAYTVGTFNDSPDYFVARGFGPGEQVTRTNAFQAEYAWGRSELIDFENTRGQRLQGALFYPADYEPGRQYPMITYIYEIRSPAVHSYYVPSERSAYNTAVWTSQGYFVFQPDIVYRDRNPGLSAVEALVPAVEAVVETGMVDPDRIGLVGHSWGGYQTAFVPTQTDIFAAAVAGAPLTELTSMYLSIYWNSGSTDARIFEISQGRMEVPPWEDLESYNANSPVHHIESLNTPMLMAFGTEDGAVDWDQGTLMYNAARRAGKDLVLLVYEGENHGLAKKPNQIDYHRRINQWFAHYLKGEPAAQWMTDGVPYLQQEEGAAKPARIITDGGGS